MPPRQKKLPLAEPYASRLDGLVHFHDLATAEASLLSLHAARREYAVARDHAGVRAVESLALEGKQLAKRIAASRRVSEAKRREKREIAEWFRVWLESPEIFFDWLDLRKQSEEFRRMFGGT